jgi:hypothetical protein
VYLRQHFIIYKRELDQDERKGLEVWQKKQQPQQPQQQQVEIK